VAPSRRGRAPSASAGRPLIFILIRSAKARDRPTGNINGSVSSFLSGGVAIEQPAHLRLRSRQAAFHSQCVSTSIPNDIDPPRAVLPGRCERALPGSLQISEHGLDMLGGGVGSDLTQTAEMERLSLSPMSKLERVNRSRQSWPCGQPLTDSNRVCEHGTEDTNHGARRDEHAGGVGQTQAWPYTESPIRATNAAAARCASFFERPSASDSILLGHGLGHGSDLT
jgi:hypothetical protein